MPMRQSVKDYRRMIGDDGFLQVGPRKNNSDSPGFPAANADFPAEVFFSSLLSTPVKV